MMYQVQDAPELFAFHDAVLRLLHSADQQLVLEARHLNARHGTSFNPGGEDLEIRQAQVTFSGVSGITAQPGQPWENGKPLGEQVILQGPEAGTCLRQMFTQPVRVLSFSAQGRSFSMECCSPTEPFMTFTWQADSCGIAWDEYAGPAWYEAPEWKEQRRARAARQR